MALTIGELAVLFRADTSQIDSAMSKVHSNAQALEGELNNLSSVGRNLTMGLTVPVIALGVAAIKTAGQFEQTRIGLTSMLKSGEKATKMWADLRKLTMETPFEFGGIATAAQRVMAYGFAAQEVIPILKDVADATAALGQGQPAIDSIVRALGQMRTAQKVNAQDMRQLTEVGISAWEMLAKKLNVDVGTAMKLVTKGSVDAATGVAAIREGIKQAFGGASQAQMDTFMGKWSNLKDRISDVLDKVGKPLLVFAKQVVDTLDPVLQKIGQMAESFSTLPVSTQKAIIGVGLFVAAIGPAMAIVGGFTRTIMDIGPALATMAKVLGAGGLLAAISTPIGLAVTAVLALGTAAYLVIRNWEGVKAFFKDLAVKVKGWINDLGATLWAQFAVRFPALANGMYIFLQKLGEAWGQLKVAVEKLFSSFSYLWAVAVKPAVKVFWDSLVTVWKSVYDLLKKLGEAFMTLLASIGLDKWTLLKIAILAIVAPLLILLKVITALAGGFTIIAGAIDLITGAFSLNAGKMAEGVTKIADGINLLKQALSLTTERELLKGLNAPMTGTPAAPITGAGKPGRARQTNPAYAAWVREASLRYGVPEDVIWAVMQEESGQQHYGSNGRVKRGGAGEYGAMQLMPGTAAALGVDPTDPRQNILGGAHYIAQQLQRFGNLRSAIAAYNAGPGAVARGRIPISTQGYVNNIIGRLTQWRGSPAGAQGEAADPVSGLAGAGGLRPEEDKIVTLVERLVKQRVQLHDAAVALANRYAPNNRAMRLRLLAAVEPNMGRWRAEIGVTTPDTGSAISEMAGIMSGIAFPTRISGSNNNTLLERLGQGTVGKKGDMHTAANVIMQALGISPEQQKIIRAELEKLYPALIRSMKTGATDWQGAVSQIDSTIRGFLDQTQSQVSSVIDRIVAGTLGKKGDLHAAAKALLDALHITPEEQKTILSEVEKLFPSIKREMALGTTDWAGAVNKVTSGILSQLEDSAKRANDLMQNYGLRLAQGLQATEPSVANAAASIVSHLTIDPAERQRILTSMSGTMKEVLARLKVDPSYKPEDAIRALINAAVQSSSTALKKGAETIIEQLIKNLEDPAKSHDLADALNTLLDNAVADPEKRKSLRDKILSSDEWKQIVQDFRVGAASASATINHIYDLITNADKELVTAYTKLKKDMEDKSKEFAKHMSDDLESAMKLKQEAVDRIRENWQQAGEKIREVMDELFNINSENVDIGSTLSSAIENAAATSIEQADLERRFGKPLLDALTSAIKKGDWSQVRELIKTKAPAEFQKALEEINLGKAGEQFTSILEGMFGIHTDTLGVASTLSSTIDKIVQEAMEQADLEARFGEPFTQALTEAVKSGDWSRVRGMLAEKIPGEVEAALEEARWEDAGTRLGELLAKNVPDGIRRALKVGDVLSSAVDDAVQSQMQMFELNRRFGGGVVSNISQSLQNANTVQGAEARNQALDAVGKQAAQELAGVINQELIQALITTLSRTPKKDWTAYGTTLIAQIQAGLQAGAITLSDAMEALWESTATNLEESKKMDGIIEEVGRGWWRKFAEKWHLSSIESLRDIPLEAFEELTQRMEYVASDAGKRAAEAFSRQFDVALNLISSGGKVSGGLGGIVGLIGQLLGGKTGSILGAVGSGLSSGGGIGSILGGVGMAVGGPIGGIVGSLLGGLFGGGGGSKKDTSKEDAERQKMYDLGRQMVQAVMDGMSSQYPTFGAYTADFFLIVQKSIYKGLGIDAKVEADAMKKNRDAGEKIISELIKGLQSKYPQLGDLTNKIRDMVTMQMRVGWKDSADLARRLMGTDTLDKLMEGIVKAVPGLARSQDTIKALLRPMLQSAYNTWGSQAIDPQAMPFVGQSIIDGLIEGLKTADPRLQFALEALGQAISQTMKDALAISSPSKVFMDIGTNVVLGLVNGLLGGKHKIKNTVKDIANVLSGGTVGGVASKTNRAEEEAFLRSIMGQPVTISVELDGRVIATRTLELTPGILRLKGVNT